MHHSFSPPLPNLKSRLKSQKYQLPFYSVDDTGCRTIGILTEFLFFTWCRVQTIGAGYEISRETQRHQDLINFQNNLKVEMARLKSPERIAKIAKNQLGLITPTQEQMIIIP